MIIFSQIELKIGKIYGPETNKRFYLHAYGKAQKEFRFKVMRKSTKEEYDAYRLKEYGKLEGYIPFNNFYEISVD